MTGGDIGNTVRNFIKKPEDKPKIVEFEAIPYAHFPCIDEATVSTLNREQRMCYLRSKAIMEGKVDSQLADMKVGNVCAARWLNTGIIYR